MDGTQFLASSAAVPPESAQGTRLFGLVLRLLACGIASLLCSIAPLFAQGQGHVLAERLQSLQAALHKVDSPPRLPWDTVDKVMTDSLSTRAWTHLHNCEGAISGLEYPLADQLLSSASREIENVSTILDEDRLVPNAALLIENKEDKYLDVMEQVIPQNLPGRKKRALIYSEYSLNQRMLGKMQVHLCSPTKPPVPATEGTSATNYLATALDKLYDLKYEDSHKMMYQVYLAAQDALTNCRLP